MAYRRCLTMRAPLLARSFNPSFGYVNHGDNHEKQEPRATIGSYFTHSSSFGSSVKNDSWLFRFGRGSRYMSSSGLERDLSGTTDYLSNVATEIADTTPMAVEAITSQAPAMSEVAVAAADSPFLSIITQYLIDGVHSFTGFNWWASIVLSALLLHGSIFTLGIYEIKATSKCRLAEPRLVELMKQLQPTASNELMKSSMGKKPQAAAELAKTPAKLMELFKEYEITPFTPLAGMFDYRFMTFVNLFVSVDFFFAIFNMVETVPSLKNGGTLWFTDLTTLDHTCVFPTLIALTLLVGIQFGKVSIGKGVAIAAVLVSIPITADEPTALLCYLLPSDLLLVSFALAIQSPEVKKARMIKWMAAAKPSTALPETKLHLTVLRAYMFIWRNVKL